jgi:Fe-S-cluster containining protein
MKNTATSPDPLDFAQEIQAIGFSCQRCGACCRPGQDDPGLVFASHGEVEALVLSGAGTWDEVARPYPEFVSCGNGAAVTFGWCLRHEDGRCRFLTEHGCASYQARPWICRTYPFALEEGEIMVSDCPGVGIPMSIEDALTLAEDLLERARCEEEDEQRVRAIFTTVQIPEGKRCVIDGSGLRICEEYSGPR